MAPDTPRKSRGPRMRKAIRVTLALSLAAYIGIMLLHLVPRSSPIEYDVKNLPDGNVHGIDNAGRVLMSDDHSGHFYLLNPDDTRTPIQTLDGQPLNAEYISASGKVLGDLPDSTAYVIWSSTDDVRPIEFDLPDEIEAGSLKAVNDQEIFVGNMWTDENHGGGIYSATEIIFQASQVLILAINNHCDASGFFDRVGRPFLISGGREISSLPETVAFFGAEGMNNRGEIVGEGYWNLRNLLEGLEAFIQIGDRPNAERHIALLYRDGSFIDLNRRIDSFSGWRLLGARGINDQGQIVGWGSFGREYANFLLTPVDLNENDGS